MRDYPTSAANYNTLVAPELPELTWSYEQRAARFGALNLHGWKHGRGMKRRHRRELSTQRALDWRAELLADRRELIGRDRLRRSWRELMHSRVAGRAPALHDLRAKISRRLALLVEHGPWTGWGVEDPHYGTPGHRHAKYVVPKASERYRRWWRALARELRRLVLLLDRLFLVLVPPHQLGQEEARSETEARTSTSRAETLGQECRDRSLVAVRTILERLGRPTLA